MARDTTFVVGTIVEAEFLNELQEVMTGTTWGLRLNQPTGNVTGVQTEVSGDPDDSRSSIIIEGHRRWLSGNSGTPAASGTSGSREIRVWSDEDAGDDLLTSGRDYNIEIIPTSGTPSGTYSRVIGTADWDSPGGKLHNIKLTNGVQADAYQQNSFVFQSIGTDVGDIPLTLKGRSTQNSNTSKMISIGADPGSGYDEGLYITGKGRLSLTPSTGSDIIIHSLPNGDSQPTFQISGDGALSWGSGSEAAKVFLEYGTTTAETVKLSGLSGNGILDTIYLQNSDTTNGSIPNTRVGAVNVLDNLNVIGDIYQNNVAVDLGNLAHLDEVETFTAAHTFDAQLNMASTRNLVFSGNGLIDQRYNSAATNVVYSASVSADVEERFMISADGSMYWGGGSAAADVELSWGGANYLELASGDQLRVQQDPVDNNDLARKGYVDSVVSSGADEDTAFAFFIAS